MAERQCWCVAGDAGVDHDHAADMSQGADVTMIWEDDGSHLSLHITDHRDGAILAFDFGTIAQARAFAMQVTEVVSAAERAMQHQGQGGQQGV